MSSAHQLVILGLIAIVGLPCNALEETDYIRTFVRECPRKGINFTLTVWLKQFQKECSIPLVQKYSF